MIRLALAAIVFCSTLCASLEPVPAGTAAALASPLAAITAQAAHDCAPGRDEGEWRPRHNATVSIPESAFKWRTLHAGVAPAPRPEAIIARVQADPLPAPASGAPSYLLHIPLLI